MCCKVALLVLCLGVVALAARHEFKIVVDPKIDRLKKQTDLLSASNPNQVPDCFNTYKPILTQATNQYETDFSKCSSTYDQASTQIDAQWASNLTQISQNVNTTCAEINNCANIVGYIEAFECFAELSAADSKAMYSISADAKNISSDIQNAYQTIDSQLAVCVNNAESTYVTSTTSTYEQLNACLNGNGTETTTAWITTDGTWNSTGTTWNSSVSYENTTARSINSP
ncbi:uncharacterized protein LOC115620272 [Scaptodrosophila lebanonensis]|uniref:Uncharacterized protein LOC115620272 n=1 Tax=Drosophila lebanonensis TaxID=7225 RepID=A0A6J2SZI5_DROLE|nr:uncharacterized protein LOC115620272 [Scaptodrosophila lebanonensis]